MTTPTTLLRALALAALLAGCGPTSRGTPDGQAPADAVPVTDASSFGVSCTTSADCPPGGYCVDGYGAKVCTFGCDAGCPASWECRATRIDGALVSVCVPPAFDLCTTCAGDTTCGGGACVPLGGQTYCLPPCPFEGACPAGYACGPAPDGSHPGERYCVPSTGSCSCTLQTAGQVRTCTTSNGVGTCQGLETCDPAAGGWSGCTAPVAGPEVCDGVDNDCNQLIDDGTSGASCAVTVAGVGTCPGVVLCTGAGGPICQGQTPRPESCDYADDDCDGLIDEAFPDAGMVCSAGVGACQRFGVRKCAAAGDATECSATPAPPMAERCNGMDDDCDGAIDDDFPTLGQTCTVGVGQCTRAGTEVCDAAGAGTRCSGVPGAAAAEGCNTLDDDCDGKVDEDYRTSSGAYALDTACGSCTIDCTALYALPNATGRCVVTTGPQCAMACATGAFDLDGVIADGCEFVLDPGAIYVSIADPFAADDAGCGLGPVGTGAGNHPCRTIAQGTTRANALNRPRILVANGIYTAPVTLANGRSLLGGYFPDTWERDVAATGTVLSGAASVGVHDRTVTAVGITSATTLEGFAIYGSVNAKLGGNSYAIYAAGSGANLTIKNNIVFGGRGGPGGGGGAGADGASGASGAGRNPNLAVADAAYDAKTATGTGTCNASNNRQYANGGVTSCGGDDVSGGNGGGNRCPAATTAVCTGCSIFGCTTCAFSETTAVDGFIGQAGVGASGGAGGAGQWAGDDMILHADLYRTDCYLPSPDADADPDKTYGLDGDDGARGAHGATAAGCAATGGAVVAGEWVGALGGVGAAGGNGGGGGGGGAGGGSHCDGCASGKDILGAHGGGGGAGGCGGGGGGAASAGGGAFGLFIVGTAAPVVTGNTFYGGQGGVGGNGGAAGKGGQGGGGGGGGTQGVPVVFCGDLAGRGGNGGAGGNGAGGGGGCGGSTFGIYTSGIGAPNYCATATANSFTGGAGGAGGAGGYSLINPGGAGAAGAVTSCSFN